MQTMEILALVQFTLTQFDLQLFQKTLWEEKKKV